MHLNLRTNGYNTLHLNVNTYQLLRINTKRLTNYTAPDKYLHLYLKY